MEKFGLAADMARESHLDSLNMIDEEMTKLKLKIESMGGNKKDTANHVMLILTMARLDEESIRRRIEMFESTRVRVRLVEKEMGL